MGSGCCKNVRVTGVPQQQPVKVNNNPEDQNKNSIPSVPPPTVPIETNPGKNDTQTFATDLNPDENNKTSTSIRLPDNEPKLSVPSQFPPIRRSKHPTETDQKSSTIPVQSFSKTTISEKSNDQTLTVRLPPLHRPNHLEIDDHLLESVSDESHSEDDRKLDDDWRLTSIPDRADFYDDDRFFTSTPIPPSPDHSDSDEDHIETLNYLLRPLSNHIGSYDARLSAVSNMPRIVKLHERENSEKYFQPVPIPNLALSPQTLYALADRANLPMIRSKDIDDSDQAKNSFDDSTIYLGQSPIINTKRNNIPQKIESLHAEAFDEAFNMLRQYAIENSSYRLIIEAWRPTSIEQLVDQIKKFPHTKTILDRVWIVFYWIARNIEYDTVPYVGKKLADKSAEAVFRTRKAIGDGYANLFRRLCDDLELTCEKIHGYSKTYIFDLHSKSTVPLDHTWNAVQISQYWYLVDVTCGAGHLDDNQVFKRELNPYYFLSPPHEIIYHHMPAMERWQLLKIPINMAQYMQMPKLWPQFFQHDLRLINPIDTIHVDLDPRQSYAIVLMQAPRYINLIAAFLLNDKEVDGGCQVVYDARKHLYTSYFAPTVTGVHMIRFFAKNEAIEHTSFTIVAQFELDVRQIPSKAISFPKTWRTFSELNLEIVWPCDTHLIKMDHGDTHTEILIRAPNDVELVGRLAAENNIRVPGGHCTYLDRRKAIWRCLFAPNRDGLFDAFILAKRRLDPGSYAIAVRFRIKAKRIPIPPLSYPKTWQLFHDLDLQVETPRNSAVVLWPEFSTYAQMCIRTPDDVRLMSCIERNGFRVESGSLTQFNREKQYWQLFFAPERTGEHKLLVFVHCSTPDGIISGIAAEFYLNVVQLRHSMKFPVIYSTFLMKKCRIYEPMDGILKRNTTVWIHCEIPNARQVDLTIDSKWVKSEGYQNSILKRQILVGTKDVIIYAKYDENTIYSELIKYIVQ